MKKMKYLFLIILTAVSTSCNSQERKKNTIELGSSFKQDKALQIGEYVTGVFEDSNGHFWFGTIQKGIARYDGNNLKYFTKKEGLPSNRVTSVIEDDKGNFWFNTDEGLLQYDGRTFTNFPVKKDDFYSNMVSQLFIDSKGRFWVGTWGGVYKFDGKSFTHFPLPYPKITTQINEDTKNWITDIKEDTEGNIWFARDGYGVCKYDGKSFTHFLKKDGLHSNNVIEIEFDKAGNIWFGTRVAEKDNADPNQRTGNGGVNFYNGKTFKSFPEILGFNKGDVFEIFRDQSDNIWISTTNEGVYKFNGTEFINYNVPISIMNMKQDKKGNVWLGGAGGLYKINLNNEIINVTVNGPWE